LLRENIIKSILFTLFLLVLIRVLRYFEGHLFILALLLVLISLVYSFAESKLVYYVNKIVQSLGRKKQ